MVARASMTSLIAHLRQKANASNEGETFNGVTYWSDDQLQDILDSYSEVGYAYLQKQSPLDNVTYFISLPKTTWIEDGFSIYQDGTTSLVTTTYTFTPSNNRVVFDSSVPDLDYNLQGTLYAMNLAIAEVWLQKAQQRENYITFKAGSHRMEAGQERDYCYRMYEHYRQKNLKSFKRGSRRFAQ